MSTLAGEVPRLNLQIQWFPGKTELYANDNNRLFYIFHPGDDTYGKSYSEKAYGMTKSKMGRDEVK